MFYGVGHKNSALGEAFYDVTDDRDIGTKKTDTTSNTEKLQQKLNPPCSRINNKLKDSILF